MKTDKPRNAMPCLKKSLLAVPSTLLIALIFWTYYTYLVEFCILELISFSTRQIVYLAIGNVFFLMFIWCYFHVMMCRANYRIPPEFKLSPVEHNRLLYLTPPKQSEVLEQYVQNRHITLWLRTVDNLIRYCMKCHLIKPDRAHHCSACERCVLKMDHHCPWTNNCVGFANQKSFMLMLMYGILASTFFSGIVTHYYLHIGLIKPDLHTGFICSGLVSSLLIIVGGCAMLQEQLYNLLKKNETFLESYQKQKQSIRFEDECLTFNLGYKRNFVDCFGKKRWKWLIPISTTYCNGIVYRVCHKKNKANLA